MSGVCGRYIIQYNINIAYVYNIICIHLYYIIAAGIYALYVRSMGWFWRVTGGGDRTQWFCVCAALRERSLPLPKAFSPAKSSWEIVSGTTLTHPFAPCSVYPYISPLLPVHTPRPHAAHCIIINIGLNLLCTHTHTIFVLTITIVLFTAVLPTRM